MIRSIKSYAIISDFGHILSIAYLKQRGENRKLKNILFKHFMSKFFTGSCSLTLLWLFRSCSLPLAPSLLFEQRLMRQQQVHLAIGCVRFIFIRVYIYLWYIVFSALQRMVFFYFIAFVRFSKFGVFFRI